ncbi:MAG: methyltransferase domain-containing protein [Nanoarchaeota archaeon]
MVNTFDNRYISASCYWGLLPNNVTKLSLKYISGKKILDLGVGEGRDALYLAKNGFEVTGVDTSKIALNKIKCKNIFLVQSNIEQFKYPFQYNAIFCLNTLHFLRKEKINQVISSMKNNTLPNGINVIKVFTIKDPSYNKKNSIVISHFQENELKNYYTDWKIVYYKEHSTKQEKHGLDGKWHCHGIAEIIALK